MAFLIGGANSAAATGFDVANSCRFNDGDTATLEKALGTPTSQKKFTYSCWFKRGVLSGDQSLFSCGSSGDDEWNDFRLGSGGEIQWYIDRDESYYLTTDRLFRDVSAFYHFVIAVDTTQATDTNRVKIYVNGTQIPTADLNVTGYPAENYDLTAMASGENVSIGKRAKGGALNLDGYLAECCFIDGLALTPTSFGEYDSDSPTIWKPIDVSGLTFGNNGFYLDFEDSSNLGNDANGGTDLTEANLAAADQATDTPTNNFCTMNVLDNEYVDATFSEGNNQIVIASGTKTYATGTMGVSAGKWYWEVEMDAYSGSSDDYQAVGIADRVSTSNNTDSYAAGYPANFVYTSEGTFKESGTTNTIATVNSYAPNDIVGVALDLTNNKLYFSKNGTWQDSGDPESGATGTGAMDVIATSHASSSGFYFPLIGSDTTARGATWKCNFGGCSAFAVSSANQDANTYGNFEYAVPSGYLALCTKNLGSDGG